MDLPPALHAMRHSGAHLLAAAIASLYPHAKFGIGPATEHGFFYDVDVDPRLTDADFVDIELRIEELRAQCLPFVRSEVSSLKAAALMQAAGQPYKVELVALLTANSSANVAQDVGDASFADASAKQLSIYRVGTFVDLCRGPHVAHSGQVGVIRLRSIAGAYWRGRAENPQMQRIHALCYPTQAELDAALATFELAAARDHRKLGRELELFAFSEETGAGLPLWLPNGTVIREELEQLAREHEHRSGYCRVVTPHIAKAALYRRSGHLEHYAEDMYSPIDIDGELYYLRPMNCPHHHELYLQRKWSYRELPVRLTEYGQVYRYEHSGALSGLMRTRGFCQNDAHIYCRPDQATSEFLNVMRLHERYYRMFNIERFWMRLSLPDLSQPGKYAHDPEGWNAALSIVRAAMSESGLPHTEVKGEAAFYGPKVDFMIQSAVGTQYAISTNQLDFVAARRFGLSYTSADGSEQPLYVIHRAPLGSHERFVAFLLEHFGGALPTWLAPLQVLVVPLAERHCAYAERVAGRLRALPTRSLGARATVDATNERMQKKIRNAVGRKIPYVLVVGDREVASQTVSVRVRGGADRGEVRLDDFVEDLADEIDHRR